MTPVSVTVVLYRKWILVNVLYCYLCVFNNSFNNFFLFAIKWLNETALQLCAQVYTSNHVHAWVCTNCKHDNRLDSVNQT